MTLSVYSEHVVVLKWIEKLCKDKNYDLMDSACQESVLERALLSGSIPDVMILDFDSSNDNINKLLDLVLPFPKKTRILALLGNIYYDQRQSLFHKNVYGIALKAMSRYEINKRILDCINDKVLDWNSVLPLKFFGYFDSFFDWEENRKKITSREKTIIQSICDGYSSKEIASMEFISINTVIAHKANIHKKLNVKNNIELLRVSLQMGLYRI